MPKATASFFSVLFHPLFLPTYAILFINWISAYQLARLEPEDKMKFFLSVIINTVVFPLLTVFIMRRLDMVKSFFLRDRQERIIPLVAISIFYFWAFMVVRSHDLSAFLTALFLGGSLAVFASFFFNLFFKVSVHTVGAGVFLALVFLLTLRSSFNLEVPLLVIIIFAGLVGSARWYLDEHDGLEIFSGYVVGFASVLVAFRFVG